MEDDRTAPNFWYKPLDFKVWWYKYIGRSVEVNKQLSDDDFKKMVDVCMSSQVAYNGKRLCDCGFYTQSFFKTAIAKPVLCVVKIANYETRTNKNFTLR